MRVLSYKGDGSEIEKDQWQCFWPKYLEGLNIFCQLNLSNAVSVMD